MLSTKNHSGGLDGSEDHADGKILSTPGSKKCPVQTIKAYLSHLNPEVDALFQRPKDISRRFNPGEESVWFERKVLGHNMLENIPKNMTQIEPGSNLISRITLCGKQLSLFFLQSAWRHGKSKQ